MGGDTPKDGVLAVGFLDGVLDLAGRGRAIRPGLLIKPVNGLRGGVLVKSSPTVRGGQFNQHWMAAARLKGGKLGDGRGKAGLGCFFFHGGPLMLVASSSARENNRRPAGGGPTLHTVALRRARAAARALFRSHQYNSTRTGLCQMK